MDAAEKKLTKEQEGMRDAICQIRGVLYAHLVFDIHDDPLEIHVVSNMTRAPKQVARDIESLMLARFDMRIDHKIISVAQMEEPEKEYERSPVVRLECEGFGSNIRKNRLECSVALSYDGVLYQGQARGMLDHHARTRVMVEATLDAVHKFLKKDDVFSLLELKIVNAVNTSVAMVCLSVSALNTSDLLVGSAFLNGDPQQCVMKATMDAINRKITMLIN